MSVLDAIELTFAPRNGVTFDDTDFYAVDPKANPIAITVTIGDLHAEFLKEDRYGRYLQGWETRPPSGWRTSLTRRAGLRTCCP
jgi:putative ATP-dependent endonuclease of OLD family